MLRGKAEVSAQYPLHHLGSFILTLEPIFFSSGLVRVEGGDAKALASRHTNERLVSVSVPGHSVGKISEVFNVHLSAEPVPITIS